jgi:hypothetical protein
VHFAFLILVLAADFIFGAPTLLLPSHGAAFRISGAVAGFLAVALTSPVATIGMSLVYYEERAHKEGLKSLFRITPERCLGERHNSPGGTEPFTLPGERASIVPA